MADESYSQTDGSYSQGNIGNYYDDDTGYGSAPSEQHTQQQDQQPTQSSAQAPATQPPVEVVQSGPSSTVFYAIVIGLVVVVVLVVGLLFALGVISFGSKSSSTSTSSSSSTSMLSSSLSSSSLSSSSSSSSSSISSSNNSTSSASSSISSTISSSSSSSSSTSTAATATASSTATATSLGNASSTSTASSLIYNNSYNYTATSSSAITAHQVVYLGYNVTFASNFSPNATLTVNFTPANPAPTGGYICVLTSNNFIGTPVIQSTTISSTATSVIFGGVPGGAIYACVITPTGSGTEIAAAIPTMCTNIQVTNIVSTSLPAPPTNVTATATTANSVTLSWTASANATLGYVVNITPSSPTATGTNEIALIANWFCTGTSTQVPFLTSEAGNINFTVQAINNYGQSVVSNTVTSIPAGTALPAPTSVGAGYYQQSPGNYEITVSWTAPTGSVASSSQLFYNVNYNYTGGTNSGGGAGSNDLGIGTLSMGTSNYYTFYNVQKGAQYTFQVIALNLSGVSGESVTSTPLTIPSS